MHSVNSSVGPGLDYSPKNPSCEDNTQVSDSQLGPPESSSCAECSEESVVQRQHSWELNFPAPVITRDT